MTNSVDYLKNKVIAVTGASGYIGSSLVDSLIKKSCSVILVSRNEFVDAKDAVLIRANIRDYETWIKIVEQADLIYHLGGNTSVHEAEKNPEQSLISSLLPINHLVKAAQELRRKPRVIYASTATVYGLTPSLPVSESFEPSPITFYDQHKYFSEKQLNFAAREGLIECISLRLSNVYGPSVFSSSSADRGVLNKVAAMALQNKDITIYGDGNYLRDYIYIDDVVNAFLVAGEAIKISGQVFNIATGRGIKVGDAFQMIANRVLDISGMPINIKYSRWHDGANKIDFRNYIADPTKAFQILGWQYQVSLENGIDKMLQRFIFEGVS